MKKEIPKSESKYLKLSSCSNHFIFYYDKNLNEEVLEDIKINLENSYQKVRSFFKERKLPIVSVYIHPSLKTFHEECYAKKMPKWVVACSGGDFVALLNPSKVEFPYNFIVNKAVVHELAHTFTLLDNVLDRPRWLLEGVADYVADSKRYINDKFFVYGIKNSKFPNIKDLATSSIEGFYEKNGYPFSETIIAFIIRKFGKEKLLEILKNPKKSVYKILNKSEKNFQTEWEEYVKRVYYKKVKKYFHLV